MAVLKRVSVLNLSTYLDSVYDQVEGFFVLQDVRRKSTLVTYSRCVEAKLLLNARLQVMVDLAAHLHGFREVTRTGGQDHKLLHGQFVASVGATVDHIERWHRQDDLVVASQLGDVPVTMYVYEFPVNVTKRAES